MTEDKVPPAESCADAVKKKTISNLEGELDIALTRGRAGNLEAGNKLNKLKPLFAHGSWSAFLKKKAKAFGVTERTLRNYMQVATDEEKAAAEKENFSFSPATDEQATKIKNANQQAKEAYHAEAKPDSEPKPSTKPKSGPKADSKTKSESKPDPIRLNGEGLYNVPLRLAGDERDALDLLSKSQNWYAALMEITLLVKRLLKRYGYLADPYQATDNDVPAFIITPSTREAANENHPLA
jgi:hypothetical protein